MQKNTSLALNLCLMALGMLGLAYASVPLYRLFCAATGYGGTTQQSTKAPTQISARTFTIYFNADTDPNLPWKFAPEDRAITIHVGQQTLTRYHAENTSNQTITGHATYNVVPFSAGSYFTKIECFCFKEQTLKPHETVEMPVLFYLDPAISDDAEMKDVKTITLSYTFFPVKKDQ